MPKRSSKPRPRDPNALAFQIVAEATGEAPAQTEDKPEKNPAAVALGKLGGMKGGAARAKALSAKQRRSIAKKAAAARWQNR